VAFHRRALELKPENANAQLNLGEALQRQGRIADAQAAYRRALDINPRLRQARFNLSLVELLLGDLRAGWTSYEARWDVYGRTHPAFSRPQWQGGSLAGKTILLHREQGLGDTLQFARYATLVARRGGRVVLETQKELLRLLASLEGVHQLVASGEPLPHFDVHSPLMSLPRVFETTLETIPAEIPYLHAVDSEAQAWAFRLGSRRCLRVGLVWAGNARKDDPAASLVDRRRSIQFAQLGPLGQIPGIEFYSLQKGPPAEQASQPGHGLCVIDHTVELRDFADTAALVANLDLVISVDTSVAHLVGAMGKPVWMLSRFDGCWRWLRDRPDSPWYPTLRIFRQARPDSWEDVIDNVRGALAEWARVPENHVL
jgi:hypothetical protein